MYSHQLPRRANQNEEKDAELSLKSRRNECSRMSSNSVIWSVMIIFQSSARTMITSNIALFLIIQELARMMLACFSSFKTKCVSDILVVFLGCPKLPLSY